MLFEERTSPVALCAALQGLEQFRSDFTAPKSQMRPTFRERNSRHHIADIEQLKSELLNSIFKT
jgi:hypothetical protein